ncbi:hypothetical protein [Scytonema sp. NUACC26]|uniref:hypothetical protein n=1 Tax=Scytonema sp. NUACC26 TaxID=3140176 RepID=UPI0038B3B643
MYNAVSEQLINLLKENLETIGETRGGVNESNLTDNEGIEEFLFEQDKKISQLIARSWLQKDDVGKQFRDILISSKSSQEKSDEIKNFLQNQGIAFPKELFSQIKVNWESFGGKIEEEPGRERIYLLPYPPRPFEVKDEQLEKWINDNNPERIEPEDPYIPLSFF